MGASRSFRIAFAIVALLLGALIAPFFAVAASAGAPTPIWSIQPSPNVPRVHEFDSLRSVSCQSLAKCFAVGYYRTAKRIRDHTLIESWNGSAWSVVPSPNTGPTLENNLFGVSCSDPSNCFAVGSSDKGRSTMTLIEAWNGSAWSIVPSPNAPKAQVNDLNGVSCSSPLACTAVGFSIPSIGFPGAQPLVESWNGSTWSIVPSPTPSTDQNGILQSVSCRGPRACTAVGSFTTSGPVELTLIESWNGSVWSVVPSPNFPNGQSNILYGVSCTRRSACMAVGNAVLGAAAEPLIESWNGSVWTITPSPVLPGISLFGVSCTAASRCITVGGALSQTLIESWNGKAWSVVPSPNPLPTGVALLGAVSCFGPSKCTAVGENAFSDGVDQTLVESSARQ
jgi:hypothetical protein